MVILNSVDLVCSVTQAVKPHVPNAAACICFTALTLASSTWSARLQMQYPQVPADTGMQCDAGSQAKQATLAMPGNEGGKTHCQNALLNLGSTHAHFGHVQVPPYQSSLGTTCAYDLSPAQA